MTSTNDSGGTGSVTPCYDMITMEGSLWVPPFPDHSQSHLVTGKTSGLFREGQLLQHIWLVVLLADKVIPVKTRNLKRCDSSMQCRILEEQVKNTRRLSEPQLGRAGSGGSVFAESSAWGDGDRWRPGLVGKSAEPDWPNW